LTSTAHPSAAPAPAFKVRPARRGDGEAISALLRQLGYENAADTQTMNWVISHPEIEVFVAGDAHDRPVGMISFSHRPQLRMKGRIITVDELVVAETWRRRGVGRALLKKVLDRARTLSAKRIELVTHVKREELPQEFYRACGFAEADVGVFRCVDLDFQRR
jgi:GNAT superfamily N-acetyltransferase